MTSELLPPPPDPAGDPLFASPPPAPIPARRLWAAALGAGLLAAAASAWLGELLVGTFVPPVRMVNAMGIMINNPTFANRILANARNATLGYGALGLALGLGLGLAGGLARGLGGVRGIRPALIGALLGLGPVLAAAAVVLPIYNHALSKDSEEMSRDLLLPFLVHGSVWAAAGLGAGAALGLGLGLDRRGVTQPAMGGLLGGLIGAIAYEVIGATVFPNGGASEPQAYTAAPRILACFLVALPAAALAALLAREALAGHRAAKPGSMPTPAAA